MAKWFRDLNVRNDTDVLFSDLLDDEDFAADPIWSMSASKDNPVGFFQFVLEQRLDGNDVTQYYRPAEPVVKIDTQVLADKIVERALDPDQIGGVREYHVAEEFGLDKDEIRAAMLLLEDDERVRVYRDRFDIYWEVSPARNLRGDI